MEVGQAVLALDFVDSELDLTEGMVFVVLEIGEGNFENSTLEGVVGGLETGCAVHQGLSDTVNSIVSGSLPMHILPIPYQVDCGCYILSRVEGGWGLD